MIMIIQKSGKKNVFNSKDIEILFGANATLDDVFDQLDVTKDGVVSVTI